MECVLIEKIPDNEVYYTIFWILLVKIMLCSKLHCHKSSTEEFEQFSFWSCYGDTDNPVYQIKINEINELRASPGAFSAVLSTEGRVVGPCWEESNPKGPTGD
jgi:hypothetical protein